MTGAYAKFVVVGNRTGAGGRITILAIKTTPADGTLKTSPSIG